MSTPIEIKVKDFVYKVIEVDEDDKEIRSNDPERVFLGRTMTLEQKILIRKDLQPNRKLQVIIHEITHVFIDAYGMSENRAWNDEQLCSFLESFGSDIVALANDIFRKLVS